MAIHSSILAWEIPWTQEPSGVQSMGLQDLDTTLATETNTQYRLDTIQERISELWDISIETSKAEKKKKLRK